MVREKLCKYFSDREFKKVDLHHEQTDLYYVSDEQSAQLVWILSEEFFKSLNKESYLHYYNKLTNTFISRGFSHVTLLALVISGSPKDVQLVASGTPFWVVDEAYGRVVIYDNMPEDFLGIKSSIEAMVSLLSADKQQEEVWHAHAGHSGYTDNTANAAREHVSYANSGGVKFSTSGGFTPKKIVQTRPYVVFTLIISNFILLLITDMFNVDSIIVKGANSWVGIFTKGEWYRLVTCMFLHSGIDHFIGNMIVLFAAGALLERVLGHWGFLIFYILGGIGASLGSSLYYRSIEKGTFEALIGGTTSIGASGAVYAVVMGLFFFFLMHKEARYMLGANRIGLFVLYFGYTIYSGIMSTGIDNAAHISGAIVGGFLYLVFNCLGKGNVGDV